MKQSLRVIHVEDSIADSELIGRLLQEEGLDCNIYRVETRDHLVEALRASECDLILSDCTLPQFHGLEALEIARATKPEIPFIFVSGTIGEEAAIDSLQNGATDYVHKQRLSRLAPAVRRALTEAEGRCARSLMEAQLRESRKLEAIGTSVGGLAHDFRNLLQVLKLGLELLPLEAEHPENVRHLAERMTQTTDRGCQMIEELMVFARKTDTHLIPVNMVNQITETTQMLQGCLPANIALHLHLEQNISTILGDPTQLDRILTNLFLNARDAMPDGGRLLLQRLERDPGGRSDLGDG
jgi:two-component system, cell cycle sensor histidine kinase and response regulator CckA